MRTPGGWFDELTKEDTHWLPAKGKAKHIETLDDDYILNIYYKLQRERERLSYRTPKSSIEIVIPDLILNRVEKIKYDSPELFL